MAHEIGGTFNKSQFDRLVAYARAQIGDIPARIAHLTAEQQRIGTVNFKYDTSNVVAYEPSPPNSYIGRLLRAYEVLGGDAFYDLPIRQKSTQPLFRMRGDETRPSQLLNNGRVIATEVLADAPSAVIVQAMKDWMHDSLQYKRDALERKIRRAIDYSDQLGDEISLLKVIQGDTTVDGSLENLIQQITQLMTSGSYRAISDDKGMDPFGTMTHAPYAGLEPGPKRPEVDGYYRTFNGYVTPNDGNDTTSQANNSGDNSST